MGTGEKKRKGELERAWDRITLLLAVSTCKLPWEDARVRPSWLLWRSHLLAVSRWPDPVPFGVRKRSGRVLVASFGKPG